MANLKRAKAAVAIYQDNLCRHSEWIRESIDQATLAQVRIRLDDVIVDYPSYLKNQLTIEAESEDDDASNTRKYIDDLYYHVRPALEERLEELKLLRQKPIMDVYPAPPQLSAKLPEIALTTFSGDIMKWTEFIESFDSLVHANSNLSTIAKFQYLKHALKDAAANSVESLDFTEANYEVARDILKERFNRPNRICDHHIQWLFNARTIDKPCPRRLMELLDGFNSHLRSLSTLNRPTAQWDDLLVFLISSKFDSETKAKWHEAAPSNKLATFVDITKFIKARCAKLEFLPKATVSSISPKFSTPSTSTTRNQSRLLRYHNTSNSYHVSTSMYHCVFCNKSSHSILRCFEFLKLSITDRRSNVEKQKICFNCLKPGHFVGNCPATDTCKICRQKHHTLLHLSTPSTLHSASSSSLSPQPPSSSSDLSKPSTSNSLTSFGRRQGPSHVFLATAVITVLDKFGSPVSGRALLDSGSQVNFISQSFAAKLRIPLERVSSEINGIGCTAINACSSGWIKIKSMATSFSADLEVLVLPSIANLTSSIPIDLRDWSIPSNLQLADPCFKDARRIDLLIGAEIYFDLMSVGQIKLGKNLPTLQNTLLGWIVSGRVSSDPSSNQGHVSMLASYNSTIDDQIEKFWQLESIPLGSKIVTTNDHPCDQHFVEHFKRDQFGRFVVRLPFTCPPISLGDSSTMAMRRFYNLEKRLCRDASLHVAYKAFIDEYCDLGHMELVPENQIPSSNFYLPHHCVLKPDSSTTQLRVVFDGSAKTDNGKGYSLNDVLMVGPVVQNDLVAVLCRFRAHKYAFSTDVSKMYRQIRVHDDDCDYQMIFWRNHPSERLQSFRLKTVTYGTSSAPFLATRCLVQCAIENEAKYPTACNAIRFDMYVDDMLTGSSTIHGANKLKKDIVSVLSSAGMELRKWCATAKDIISDVPEAHRETLRQLDDGDYIKTLGIFWQPQRDVFQFRVQSPSTSSKLTKRTVISEIARLFDPLGFVAPVVVLGKLFMQKLWQLKLDWDEALPMKYHTYWSSYRYELSKLNELFIPRFLFCDDLSSNTTIELHGFADASETAFGAVIYTRCSQSNGEFIVNLLCSKSRVAPLQKTTLPRLELCAAQLLAQLMSQVRTIINFPVTDVIYWTDSTIVLHWLRSSPSNWKTFVANRVSNIQELTDTTNWHHIESKQNPADVVSRGLMPSALLNCNLWFSGPQLLKMSTSPWLSTNIPVPNCIESEYEHRKPTALIVTSPKENQILTSMKYLNNYQKLIRVMAFASRFIHNSRNKMINRIVGPLSRRDFDAGLMTMIHFVQSESFPVEKEGLRKPNFIIRSSHLKSLSLFRDENGLIRVGGRLQHSTLPYSSKHPILLPYSHPVTKTIITFIHRKHLHLGPQALLATVRDRFWPINGRRLATQIYRDCIRCRRFRPTPVSQLMGELPKERVEPAPPFHVVGIDFCGPFFITQRIRGKAPIKTYLCIFVCFGTKAVHLELVADLTTDAFLGAFRRFCATRGLCKKVFSDNGTNFVGANSQLHELYQLLQDSDLHHDIKRMCQYEEIEWHFAPPRSPHFGGLYEAAVKSAKYHLRRVMGTLHFTYEELNTLCKQVEAILNSRPITPLSSLPDELTVLTPGHLLIGRPLTAVPESNITGESISYNKRWRLIQQLAQHFWARWSRDYLQTLQQRKKWTTESHNIKIGQVVVLKEENMPPMKWRMGTIIGTNPGPDGLVRVVIVKTAEGVYKRAISKVCPLPLEIELDESSSGGA